MFRPAVLRLERIAPKRAAAAELATITGRGLGPRVAIRVGGVPAVIVCASDHRVTFRIPAGVKPGPTTVTVTTPDGRAASLPFEVLAASPLVVDDADTAIGTIGPAGGSITAVSRGRMFTLTIPAGALLDDETIVLTPIVAIKGTVFDRLIGAVRFAPEGLQFLKPATLEIALPPHTNTRHMIGFDAAGSGENLHATPVDLGATFRIPIAHFSAAGLGSAASGTIFSCQAQTLECTFTTQLAAAFASAEQQACQNDCATPDDLAAHIGAIADGFRPAEVSILGAWFAKVLDLLNDSGTQTDAGLATAVNEFADWAAWVNGYPCGSVDCANDPALAADMSAATVAVAMDLEAALARSRDACSDARTADHIAEIDALGLLGVGGLPGTDQALKDEYACQLDVEATLPPTAVLGSIVGLPIALNVRHPGGTLTPLPGVVVDLAIIDGCGTFASSTLRTSAPTTNPDGLASDDIRVNEPCGSHHTTTVRVAVSDVIDTAGHLVALGHELTVTMAITVDIEIDPQAGTVAPGGTLHFEASALGSPLFTWTATGGTITPGPSTSATFTAGTTPGVFSVTAKLVDDPSQAQSVAVTVQGGAPAGVLRQSSQADFHFLVQTFDNGDFCAPEDSDPELSPAGATGATLSGGCSKTYSEPAIGVISEAASASGSITFAESYSGSRLVAVTVNASHTASASASGSLPVQTGGAEGNTFSDYLLIFTTDAATTVTGQGTLAGTINFGGGGFSLVCNTSGSSFVQSALTSFTIPPMTIKVGDTCRLRANAGASAGIDVGTSSGSVSVTVNFGS